MEWLCKPSADIIFNTWSLCLIRTIEKDVTSWNVRTRPIKTSRNKAAATMLWCYAGIKRWWFSGLNLCFVIIYNKIASQVSRPVILFKCPNSCFVFYGGKCFLVSFATIPQVATGNCWHIASPWSSSYDTSMVQVKLVPIWSSFVFALLVRTRWFKKWIIKRPVWKRIHIFNVKSHPDVKKVLRQQHPF